MLTHVHEEALFMIDALFMIEAQSLYQTSSSQIMLVTLASSRRDLLSPPKDGIAGKLPPLASIYPGLRVQTWVLRLAWQAL